MTFINVIFTVSLLYHFVLCLLCISTVPKLKNTHSNRYYIKLTCNNYCCTYCNCQVQLGTQCKQHRNKIFVCQHPSIPARQRNFFPSTIELHMKGFYYVLQLCSGSNQDHLPNIRKCYTAVDFSDNSKAITCNTVEKM